MKRMLVLCLLTIMPLFLAGCWSSNELNELAIATALGVDKSNNGYTVTVQVVDPSVLSSQNRFPGTTAVNTFTAKGKTLFEAFRKMSMVAPRQIYSAHLRVVVFGEKMAKAGIQKTLDFLSRDHEMRSDFYLLVAKDTTASRFLTILTPIDKLPADKVFNSLEFSQEKWGQAAAIDLVKLINQLTSKGDNPVLEAVEIDGDPKIGGTLQNLESTKASARLLSVSLAVFKGGKLAGWMSNYDGKGWNYIMDNIKSTIVTTPCKGGNLGVELTESKSKVKAKVVDGRPTINVQLKAEGNIGDAECKIDLTNPKNVKRIEKRTGQAIKKHMASAVRDAQKKYRSDIFGFGEAIHRTAPDYWKKVENDWNSQFTKLPVHYHVSFHLRRLGSISDSFQKESEE